ncbi:tyrosine-type recombinase/integrase [Streptosporangium sp. G11]|uniref:tyrosine-type recombinase/integrase n=1 Tax=Streptosporangium sp. G11 TaxID=3436926 RepID=UPI003EC00A1C
MTVVLDWLEGFPGDTWQERWLVSGSDAHGQGWGPQDLTPRWRNRITTGLGVLIVLRAVRPSYPWLFGSRLLGVYEQFRSHNQPERFAELTNHASRRGFAEHEAEALNALTRVVIVTGKDVQDLDLDDITTYVSARKATGRKVSALPFAYDLLRTIGGLRDAPPTLKHAQARGQLTAAELVDRYPVACRPIRDVLVHYLVERSAVLDYGSLDNQAQMLVSLFWVDLERHHPGISSLHLPQAAVHDWKQRIRTLSDGRPRQTSYSVLFTVRSFYLDLLQWSLEDPGRWAQWAAPCPVSENDVRGYMKETRRRRARMAERTRSLVPVLPRLVTAAERQLSTATIMLEAVRSVPPGGEFTIADARYLRIGPRRPGTAAPVRLLAQRLDEPGPRFDVQVAEDNAFWAWSTIEVLRRTGVRVEELLELTHLSLRQYRAPTGEMVPLLQISPSKTDTERVIPADPELVSVLARIIRRIKDSDGRVPLLTRYDTYERVFGPALPHLFQRFSQHRLQVIAPGRVREILVTVARQAGIADIDGTPLKFTPHDFRRVFSTETVNSGLPIHIAAKLLGHLDLNTTQGYVAVYPAEVIRHYRQFISDRRGHRPSEEYREPTDSEWLKFRDHFSLRKVALGNCHRPYGTPCQHEHACVRCPMLRLDLAQVPRLLQIEDNTRERLKEAHQMQWLGEVAALEESLHHIADKKQQADRLRQQADNSDTWDSPLG